MKKILIPMVAMAFFAACSDTNAPTYPVASNPTAGSSSSSEALLPVGESSSSVAPVAGVSSSSVDVLGSRQFPLARRVLLSLPTVFRR